VTEGFKRGGAADMVVGSQSFLQTCCMARADTPLAGGRRPSLQKVVPRQRQQFNIRCSLQTPSGPASQQEMRRKAPRTSVIALISEAVSINVSSIAWAKLLS
jgi:hypothetical protein